MKQWISRLRARFARSGSTDGPGDDLTDEWMGVMERVGADMHARKQALRPLAGVVSSISHALHEADPIGLASMGAPQDEYDSEAETIVLRLADRRSLSTAEEVAQIVHDEFVRWFDEDLAGDRERYEPVAAEVHRLWGEYLAE